MTRGHLALLLLPLFAAGCGETSGWDDSRRPGEMPVVSVPDREKEFADVPVPRDFARDAGSFSHEQGNVRVCRLSYQGKLDAYQTTDFMKKQMELAGWRSQEQILEGDQKILTFAKRTDRCRVTVARLQADHVTRLTISIFPVGPESAAPEN